MRSVQDLISAMRSIRMKTMPPDEKKKKLEYLQKELDEAKAHEKKNEKWGYEIYVNGDYEGYVDEDKLDDTLDEMGLDKSKVKLKKVKKASMNNKVIARELLKVAKNLVAGKDQNFDDIENHMEYLWRSFSKMRHEYKADKELNAFDTAYQSLYAAMMKLKRVVNPIPKQEGGYKVFVDKKLIGTIPGKDIDRELGELDIMVDIDNYLYYMQAPHKNVTMKKV